MVRKKKKKKESSSTSTNYVYIPTKVDQHRLNQDPNINCHRCRRKKASDKCSQSFYCSRPYTIKEEHISQMT